jgi:asparagine synthetase B (glutamine-hydrolysing)
MFFLEVTCGGPERREGENTSDPELKTLEKNGLTIRYKQGRLYSFHFDFEDHFVIGEAIIPVDEGLFLEILDHTYQLKNNLISEGAAIHNLVIVETKAKRLILAGSISGCRPLYYVADKGRFICSTHITALKNAGLRLAPNEEIYPEFCVYRYIIPPRTLYAGIEKLMGGMINHFDLQSGESVHYSPWYPAFWLLKDTLRENDYISWIEGTLGRFIQDVVTIGKKGGLLLSGGLDSMALAAIARACDVKLDSVSSSFAFINKDDREDEYALSAAANLDMNHKIVSSTPEQYLTDLVKAIHTAEEPVHHLQSVMLYRLFRESVRSGYDLFLCGEGADGLCGNDAHMKYFKHHKRIKLGRKSGLHWLFKNIYPAMRKQNDRYEYFAHDFGRNIFGNRHILWTLGRYGELEIVKGYFHKSEDAIYKSRMDLMYFYSRMPLLEKITFLSLLGEGFETMTIWSKLAEGNRLKIAYPYVYPGLIQFILQVPWNMKLREDKLIVRSLLRWHEIPGEFVARPKLSFGFPVKFWAPKGALFQPLVDMAAEMFAPDFLRSLQCEDMPKAMVLWNLLNLYLWHKMFIGDARPEDLCAEILDRRRSYQK